MSQKERLSKSVTLVEILVSQHLVMGFNPEYDKELFDQYRTEITQIFGLMTVADLEKRTFEYLLNRCRDGWHEYRELWFGAISAILRMMIEKDIRFKDIVPRNTFVTPIEKLPISGRTKGALRSGRIFWAEMLPYITQEELLGIRTFGPKCMEDLLRAGVELAHDS